MNGIQGKVRPRRRILLRMLPIREDIHNPLGLELIDKKKHWDHEFRRGVVEAMDPALCWRVPELMLGDIVIIRGDAGFTMDGDVLDEDDKFEEPLKGEGYRWMHWKEILAIDERELAAPAALV